MRDLAAYSDAEILEQAGLIAPPEFTAPSRTRSLSDYSDDEILRAATAAPEFRRKEAPISPYVQSVTDYLKDNDNLPAVPLNDKRITGAFETPAPTIKELQSEKGITLQEIPTIEQNRMALPTGIVHSVGRELPQLIGKSMEFTGVAPDIGKKIVNKTDELFPRPNYEGAAKVLYEAGSMMAPPFGPTLLVSTGTKVLTRANKFMDLARAAQEAGKIEEAAAFAKRAEFGFKLSEELSSLSTGTLFGLAQGQDTLENAKKAGVEPGAAPYINALIESTGEYLGTKYLGRALNFREGKPIQTAKDFSKMLGVETGTEFAQQYGEAGIEKAYNIRPDADPLQEGLDVLAPTAVLTGLTFGLGKAMGRRGNKESAPIQQGAMPTFDIQRLDALAAKVQNREPLTAVENADLEALLKQAGLIKTNPADAETESLLHETEKEVMPSGIKVVSEQPIGKEVMNNGTQEGRQNADDAQGQRQGLLRGEAQEGPVQQPVTGPVLATETPPVEVSTVEDWGTGETAVQSKKDKVRAAILGEKAGAGRGPAALAKMGLGPDISTAPTAAEPLTMKTITERIKGPQRPPRTIIDLVRQSGGINIKNEPQAGEVRHLMENNPQLQFYVTKTPGKGIRLDDLALKALEYGFIPERNIQMLLDAIDRKQASSDELERRVAAEAAKQKKEIVLDDMQPGDSFKVDDETFKHLGYDENGNAIIKDGITYKIPPFDRTVVKVDEFTAGENPVTFSRQRQDTGTGDLFTGPAVPEKTAPEAPRRVTQADMFGLRNALEGPLTSKQVEEDLPLERAGADEKQREAQKGQGDLSFQRSVAPFYSQLRRTVEALPDVISRKTLKAALNDPRNNVKAEEIADSGVMTVFEDQGIISKKAVLEYLDAVAQGQPIFQKAATGVGIPIDQAQAVVDRLKANWKGAPDIRVSTVETLPAHLRADMTPDVKAFVMNRSGRVYILPEHMDNLAEVESAVLHEVIGHYGIRSTFGEQLDSRLAQIYMVHALDIKAVMSRKGYDFDYTTRAGRLDATEEYVSHTAESGETPGWFTRLVAQVRDWLRNMGVSIKYSVNDIKAMLAVSRRAVERGDISYVPPQRLMETGEPVYESRSGLSDETAKGVTAREEINKTDPDWKAGKEDGDIEAANRFVRKTWTTRAEEKLADKIKGVAPDSLVFLSQPSTSQMNVHPMALAQILAERFGGEALIGADYFDAKHVEEMKNIKKYERVFNSPRYAGHDLEGLRGKTVVIVDDIYTTGGSVGALKRGLERHGIDVRTFTGLSGDARLSVDPATKSKLGNALEQAGLSFRANDLAGVLTRSEARSIIDNIYWRRGNEGKLRELTGKIQRVLDERTGGHSEYENEPQAAARSAGGQDSGNVPTEQGVQTEPRNESFNEVARLKDTAQDNDFSAMRKEHLTQDLYLGIPVEDVQSALAGLKKRWNAKDPTVNIIPDKDMTLAMQIMGNPEFWGRAYKDFARIRDVQEKRQEDRSSMAHRLISSPDEPGKTHEFFELSRQERLDLFQKAMLPSTFENRIMEQPELKRLGMNDAQVKAYGKWKESMDEALNLIVKYAKDMTLKPYEGTDWHEYIAAVFDMQPREQRSVLAYMERLTGTPAIHQSDMFKNEDVKSVVKKAQTMKKADIIAFHDALRQVIGRSEEIAGIRQEIGRIQYYVPLDHGQGDYMVTGYDFDPSTLGIGKQKWAIMTPEHRKSILMEAGSLRYLRRATFLNKHGTLKQAQKENPQLQWVVERNPGTPEHLYEEVSQVALEKFVDKALGKVEGKIKPSDMNELTKAVLQALADDLNARGFGKHKIKRTAGERVKGYQTDNPEQIFVGYMSGLSGYLTKQAAAWDFAMELKNIDPSKKSRLYKESSQYIRDMLRNTTNWDRASGVARHLAFVWYIAGRVSMAAIQLGQNFQTGIPMLTRYTKYAEAKYGKAMKDVATRNYTEAEKKVMGEAFDSGITQAQYLKDINSDMKNRLGRVYDKAIDVVSFPFSGMEEFNRKSAFLAMYRVATNEKGMDHAAVIKAGRDFVNLTHYEMSKSNLPTIARGGNWYNAAARTAYTFMPYMHNYVLSIADTIKSKDLSVRTKGLVVGKALAYLFLLGGAASLPFLDDLLDLLERKTGIPFRAQMRHKLQAIGGDWMAKFGMEGLPALIGIDISGSMALNVPKPGSMYYSMYDKGAKAVDLAFKGQYGRALEKAGPTFTENIGRAYREATEGATTEHGKVMRDEKGRPIKMTPGEAVGKALGFRPERIAEIQKERWTMGNVASYFKDKHDDLLDRYAFAKPGAERAALKQEMKAYNDEAKPFGGAVPLIKGDTLLKALMNRRRPDKRFMRFERVMDREAE